MIDRIRCRIGSFLVRAKYTLLCLLRWPDWPARIKELVFDLAVAREALSREEQAHMRTLEENETYEEFIEDTARELGIEFEWSSAYGLPELEDAQGDAIFDLRKRAEEAERELVRVRAGLSSLKMREYHDGCKFSAEDIQKHNASIDALMGTEDQS